VTDDQVIVYGGNDGTAETYNTVTVDRGAGPGQEQLVQQVGYRASAAGTLTVEDDVVTLDVSGLGSALVSFTDGGGVSAGGQVVFETSADGASWIAAEAYSEIFGWFTELELPGLDVQPQNAVVPLNGAPQMRVRLLGDLSAGSIDVVITASTATVSVPVVFPTSISILGNDGGTPTPVAVNSFGQLSIANGLSVDVNSTYSSPTTLDADGSTPSFFSAGRTVIGTVGDLDSDLVLEVSADGSTWFELHSSLFIDMETGAAGPLAAQGLWLITFDAACYLRVTASGFVSGSSDVIFSGTFG